MEEADVVKALAALAQETRLRIFRLLVVAGPDGLTPGHMSDELGAAPTALSFHLKELERAGLINQQRESRSIVYTASYEALADLGPHTSSVVCLYIPDLEKVDLDVLRSVVTASFRRVVDDEMPGVEATVTG